MSRLCKRLSSFAVCYLKNRHLKRTDCFVFHVRISFAELMLPAVLRESHSPGCSYLDKLLSIGKRSHPRYNRVKACCFNFKGGEEQKLKIFNSLNLLSCISVRLLTEQNRNLALSF